MLEESPRPLGGPLVCIGSVQDWYLPPDLAKKDRANKVVFSTVSVKISVTSRSFSILRAIQMGVVKNGISNTILQS